MKRAAYTLATAGEQVYFGKDNQQVDLDGIVSLAGDTTALRGESTSLSTICPGNCRQSSGG